MFTQNLLTGLLMTFTLLIVALPVAAQEESPGHYDSQGDSHGVMTGRAMSNQDWWPNQLNLNILHQNSLKSNKYSNNKSNSCYKDARYVKWWFSEV